MLEPFGQFQAYPSELVGVTWTAGTTFRVQAVGADAPAFELTAAAPSMFKVTSPAYPKDAPIRIVQANDLVTTWEPWAEESAAGRIHVSIRWSKGAQQSKVAHCWFDLPARTGTVPSSVLAEFPKDHITLGFDAHAEQATRIGDWEITLELAGEGARNEGPWNGQAELE